MKIDEATLDRIAALARLDMGDPAMRASLLGDMQRVIDFVQALNEVDTTGVEPLVFLTEEEDVLLEKDLRADEKERAEHVMLVDLGRNDLGRVCEYGSVQVDELMAVELYSHVIHIVSSVSGTMREDVTPMDAMRAALPAGTLSGAPKIRAMQIIDELEPVKRGPYGGAVGYLSYTGDLDTCINIRSTRGSRPRRRTGRA